MSFVHEDSDWSEILDLVADTTDREISMVEKDYWVTHALWALHEQGFDLWFKGGTSLSKGFELIARFSEDLDLRLDAGRVSGLVEPVLPWEDSKKNRRARGIVERQTWFDSLGAAMSIPGCSVTRNPEGSDDRVRSAWFEVRYPTLHGASLPPAMKSFVLLEIGRARVVPSVDRPISSWVHDHLVANDQLTGFDDNRPKAVRCVHPMVTCLEKLEAIARKFDRGKDPADFVRHYEDAAHIVARRDRLPPLELEFAALVALLDQEDGKEMPPSSHPAFVPDGSERWLDIERAWEGFRPMYWGPRLAPTDATAMLRTFLDEVAALPRG